MSKNLDETICLQSEKREEWIREIREERLLREQVALPVWPAYHPSHECLGTHCSLIEQVEREDSSCQRLR